MSMLMFDKPVNLLVSIEKEDTPTKIGKKVDITSSHVTKIVNSLIKARLLTKRIEGRKAILNLTNKGLRFQQEVKNLLSEMGCEGNE